MATLPELQALRVELIAKRQQIDLELKEVDRRITDLCTHDWKWHPIAGEGRFCRKCDVRDMDCED